MTVYTWKAAVSGNFSDVTMWTVDNGLGIQVTPMVAPGASDDLVFPNLGTTNITITSGNAAYGSLTFQDGFNATLISGLLTIAGSLRLPNSANFFFSGSNAWTLTGSGNHTVQSNGKVLGRNLTFQGTGTYTLLDALNLGTSSILHRGGTLVTSNFTVTAFSMDCTGAVARTLNYGTSTFNLSQASGTTWNVSGSNITGDAASATVNLPSTGVSINSAVKIGTVNATGGGTFNVLTTLICNNFTRNVGTTAFSGTTLSADLQVSTSLTLLANAAAGTANYTPIQPSALGALKNIIATGPNVALNVTGTLFEEIVFGVSGTGTWGANTATNPLVGDAGGNTFPATMPATPALSLWCRASGWVSAANSWSTTPTGATDGRYPLPQDNVTLLDSSMGGTAGADFTIGAVPAWPCNNLTVDSPTRRVILGSGGTRSIKGNFTVSAATKALISTGSSAWDMRPIGKTVTLQTNGNPNIWLGNFYASAGLSAAVTVADGVLMPQCIFTHGQGVLNVGSTLTTGKYVGNNTATVAKTLNMVGTYWKLDGVGTVWDRNAGSAITINANGATIELIDTSMATKTLSLNAGQSLMTGAVFKYVVDAPGTTLAPGGYFPKLLVHGGGKKVLLGSTYNNGDLELQGTPTSPLYLGSTVIGTQRAIGGVGTRQYRYLQVQDIAPTAGQNFYDSTSVGNNGSNALFVAGPPPWTSPLQTDTTPAYYKTVQKDSPAWYVSGEPGSPNLYYDRGPSTRSVAAAGDIAYDPPLTKNSTVSLQYTGNDRQTVLTVAADLAVGTATYEFWIKTTQNDATSRNIVALDNSSSAKRDTIALVNGTLTALRYDSAGTGGLGVATSGFISDGKAHHIVVIYSGNTSGTISIYVDGVLSGTQQNYSSTFVNNPIPTSFGLADSRGALAGLIASLDDIAFYQTALTPAQIQSHYTAGLSRTGRPKVNVNGVWVNKPAKKFINGSWVEKPAKVNANGTWTLAK